MVLILSSIIFILTAHAEPTNKNPHHSIKTKTVQKQNSAKKSHKNVDITVKEHRKSNDKFTDWDGKKNLAALAKDRKIISRGEKKKYEKATKDFHEWSNKTKDLIESKLKKDNSKYQ